MMEPEATYVLMRDERTPSPRRGAAAVPCVLFGLMLVALATTVAGVRRLPAAVGQTALVTELEEIPVAASASEEQRPIVMMHGIGDASTNPGFASMCESARRFTGAYVLCAPVANGWDSVTMSMQDQVDALAALVRSDPELVGGFHLVGFSQGALVSRVYVEQHNRPPVRRLVSMVGPQAGAGKCPLTAYPWLCQMWLATAYTAPVAFSGYWKDVGDEERYLRQSSFLADVNNERQNATNAAYAEEMRGLELLVLVRALNDTTIVPNESEHFGFWAWNGADAPAVPLRETDGYRADAVGLRTLDESGRLRLLSYDGEHMRFSDAWWQSTILPILKG